MLALADSLRAAHRRRGATILVIKALVDDAHARRRRSRKFPGFTDVDDLAAGSSGYGRSTPA